MPDKIDKIEKEKRIRIVMEWILEDWPAGDIIAQVENRWGVSDRQAKRYLAEARERWNDDEEAQIERKRATKVESLKKLKRSLKGQYHGTPLGIKAVLAVEKEIIELENLRPKRTDDAPQTFINQMSDAQFNQLLNAARNAKAVTSE